jgi:predicted DNA-binding transcriptional regulator YafY
VLALLEILQAGGTRTVRELAEGLDVDERTVRRYVAHLIDLDIRSGRCEAATADTDSPPVIACPR